MLLARCHVVAPDWERAVFLFADCPNLGGHRTRRYLVLLAPGEDESWRVCRECRYRWLVKPDPGQNIVPMCCPKCRGAMRWVLEPRSRPPETIIAIAPGSGMPPQEVVEWAIDFERWLRSQSTEAIPFPVTLVRFWVYGHERGRPPTWVYLAKALEYHLGLPNRPHHHNLWKAWNRMESKYNDRS
jgi:hypothetical protein